ncbi:MAG: nucleoside triphosphate pyrophosphohydrolase [Clostridia bacterium]|nr:nucleoside triphosphate pyrophosphohydrolase [Clostridia bacterium]
MQKIINVIGLGPGNYEYITLGALNLIKKYSNIYARTEFNPCIDYIKSLGIEIQSFDRIYEQSDSFEDVYSAITNSLIQSVEHEQDILYAVPGNPSANDLSVRFLIKKCDELNIELNILTGVSYVDAILNFVEWDMDRPVKALDPGQLNSRHIDTSEQIIIGPIYDRFIASETKIALIDIYGYDFDVQLVDLSGDSPIKRSIKLEYIDREKGSHAAYIFVPCVKFKKLKSFNFDDLLDIMDILRGPKGCPWDREQTYKSLKKCTLEEVYEVFDAIDSGDADRICDELGDLLFQIVFYARIAKEHQHFDMNDVITAVSKKMIERHTHIFGSETAETPGQVVENWEKNKKKKKGQLSYTQVMQDIPRNFPALLRSYKVQQKASLVGFDWDKVDDALDKIEEEINELKNVYFSENIGKIKEELGDLLFAVVNVARFFSIQPEFALNDATDKFIKRFEYIEQQSSNKGKKLETMTLEEMDKLWDQAKKLEEK